MMKFHQFNVYIYRSLIIPKLFHKLRVLIIVIVFILPISTAYTADFTTLPITELSMEQWGCAMGCSKLKRCELDYDQLPCLTEYWEGFLMWCWGGRVTAYLTTENCSKPGYEHCELTTLSPCWRKQDCKYLPLLGKCYITVLSGGTFNECEQWN